MEEADLILFMVDVTIGVHDLDSFSRFDAQETAQKGTSCGK